MIVDKQTKGYQQQSHRPAENWLNDEEYFLVPDGTELADQIIEHYPYFDFVIEDGELVGITPTERPPDPPPPPTLEEIRAALEILTGGKDDELD